MQVTGWGLGMEWTARTTTNRPQSGEEGRQSERKPREGDQRWEFHFLQILSLEAFLGIGLLRQSSVTYSFACAVSSPPLHSGLYLSGVWLFFPTQGGHGDEQGPCQGSVGRY